MFSGFISAVTGRDNNPVEELPQLEKTKRLLQQVIDFEMALKAMDFVIDDRPDQGLLLLEEETKKNEDGSDSTITTLAKGVIEFLEAVLGFEVEEMQKASKTLGLAEESSLKSKEHAEKLNLKASNLYAPGTVFAVTYTEACLLHALLMIFNDSVMDTAKALFKLRKAYYMLQEIFQKMGDVEDEKLKGNNKNSSNVNVPDIQFANIDIPYNLNVDEEEDPDLPTLLEIIKELRNKRIRGEHIGNTPANQIFRNHLGLENHLEDLTIDDNEKFDTIFSLDPKSTVDEFIASGVNLCYGLLQVVLSLIPPAIGSVLSVVGFKGSRVEGLRLLWNAVKFRNIHGCIALLGLMLYYDGPYQFTDTDFDIPSKTSNEVNGGTVDLLSNSAPSTFQVNISNSIGNRNNLKLSAYQAITMCDENGQYNEHLLLHPGRALVLAVLAQRALFPNGALWLLNEAKLLTSQGKLKEAVQLFDSMDISKIEMRQVKVLYIFERAITLAHLQEYERAASDLLYLIDCSDWSASLYCFFAGACFLELWRLDQQGIKKSEKAEYYKERATELIFKAPDYLGRKTYKSRDLPFDKFVLRKVAQYKIIIEELKLKDQLDSIATSPVYEILYFYNGFNRMSIENVKIAQTMLNDYHNPAIDMGNKNQELTKNLMLALIWKRLGEYEKGCDILDNKVLPEFFSVENGKVVYVKKAEDPWAYPSALYERALFTWKMKGVNSLEEVKEWLNRAINYAGDYELSTRIGMKIKAALGRVDHALEG